jgi:TrpR-related protein YerC/YecD
MPTQQNPKNLEHLFHAILSLKTAAECRAFFEDLATPSELTAMADRWQTAQLLEKGIAYRDINDRTGVSTATVTRVARALSMGAGGYRLALQRTKKIRGGTT